MHDHEVYAQVEVVNEEGEEVEEDCAAEGDVDGVHSGHPHTSDIALKMLVPYRCSNLIHYYIFVRKHDILGNFSYKHNRKMYLYLQSLSGLVRVSGSFGV